MLKITSTKVNTVIAVAGSAFVLSYAPAASACAQVSNYHEHEVSHISVNVHETGDHEHETEVVHVVSHVQEHEVSHEGHVADHDEKKTPCKKQENEGNKEEHEEHATKKCDHPTPTPVTTTDEKETKTPCHKHESEESEEQATTTTPSTPAPTGGQGGGYVLGASTTVPAATVASSTLADTGESSLLPSLGAAILMGAASLVKFPVFGRLKKFLGR